MFGRISKPIYNEQYHFIESDSKAEVYENDIKVYMQLDTEVRQI